MANFYLKYFEPPDTLDAGKVYALLFTLCNKKPEGESFIQLPDFPDLYLYIYGGENLIEDEELNQPLTPITKREIVIQLAPPKFRQSAHIELCPQITVGKLGPIVTPLYTKRISLYPSEKVSIRNRVKGVIQPGLPHPLRKDFAEFLTSLPNIHKPLTQNALVSSAGLDTQLKAQLHIGNSVINFVQDLINAAMSYGNLNDGRHALEAILDATKQYVGPDRQKVCDELIQALHNLNDIGTITGEEHPSLEINKSEDYFESSDFGVLHITDCDDAINFFGHSKYSTIADIYSANFPDEQRNTYTFDHFIKHYAVDSFSDLRAMGKELFNNMFHRIDRAVIKKFVSWFVKLHRHSSALLIVDATDSEIAWEILYLNLFKSPSQEEKFLGNLIAISRWNNSFEEHDKLYRNGRMVSYIHPTMRYREYEVNAVQACGYFPVESFNQFESCLERNDSRYVLVHIVCHGHYEPERSGSPLELEFEEGINKSGRVLHHEFEMKLLQNSQPVMFLNACHSGKDGTIFKSVLALREIFVAKGARGVIGAMSKIRSGIAARTAKQLFEQMQQEHPAPIAEILRRIRQKALESEDKKYVLDAFMYVYYGHPLETIKIEKLQNGKHA